MSAVRTPMDEVTPEMLAMAERFHEAYERLAPQFGYETREETRQFDPASPNGRLMIAVCEEIFTAPTNDEVRKVVKFCRERAESYGALRQSSTTAIALDKAAALLERLSPEAVRDDGWQPIETAPRDQVILAWPGPGDDPVVVFWFKPPKGPGLWYEAGTDAYSVDPSHWRPLPPPPAIRKDAPDAHSCALTA